MKAFPVTALVRTVRVQAGFAAAVLLVVGCAGSGNGASAASRATAAVTSSSRAPATVPAPAASAPPSAAAARGSVFGLVLTDPTVAVTGGRFYVAWQVNSASSALPRFELARADPVAGTVEAAHRFGDGYIGAPVTADGWLWVTTSTAQGEALLRMNPADLAVTGDLRVGDRSYQGVSGRGNQLAVAGGALWVTGGSQLLRISLPAGKVTATISLPGAYSSGVAASADGSVLIVSEANRGGLGSVQRRDPVTGSLIASHAMIGVSAPGIGGVTGSGAWVSEATGMLGYIERFSTAAMAPDPATDVGGTNGINVRVADGAVWVTDQVGSGRNYCADQITGRMLAPISLPDPGQDYLLAISGQQLYYAVPASGGFHLKRAQVPAACRALGRPVSRRTACGRVLTR
jgi:hypothetical protein